MSVVVYRQSDELMRAVNLEASAIGYTLVMLVIGLFASWIGTLLWNKASQLLPTALVAQLIVFETLAALLYAFVLRGSMPDLRVLAGIVFLCAGVVFGVRTFSRQLPPSISHTT